MEIKTFIERENALYEMRKVSKIIDLITERGEISTDTLNGLHFYIENLFTAVNTFEKKILSKTIKTKK